MNVRDQLFAPALLGLALLSGCGSSSNRDGANTPDDVASNSSGESDTAPKDTAKADQPENDTKEMPRAPKSKHEDDSVPEDYTLTDRDCIELGKQYGVVQKADQMATLSPKLTTAQKEQGEQAINDAVAKLVDGWEKGCRSSLVGGVVDRARLKCAMSSKSVKTFDECINGEPSK